MKNTEFSALEIIIFMLPFVRMQIGIDSKFQDIAPPDYDYLRPPKNGSEPIFVYVNINKLSIRSIDESDMSLSVTLELWQNWYDYRLKYPSWASLQHQVLDSSWINKIWNPKLYFINSVDGKMDSVITPSSFVWISENRKMYYCCRVLLSLICEMDLKYFPHDEQECSIQMASAIYNTNDMYLTWENRNESVQVFELQQYEISNVRKTDFLKPFGPYKVSCLKLSIQLRRRVGYYLINVYIPTVLIVIMSMLTFWIPYDAVPARITLGVTSLLTIITKQYQASMPNVSYIVALNVWLSCCIGFVFFTLLEYAAVIACNTQLRTGESEENRTSDLVLPMVMLRSNGTWSMKKTWSRKKALKEKRWTKRLDYVSRILFPLGFLSFCIFYWRYYN